MRRAALWAAAALLVGCAGSPRTAPGEAVWTSGRIAVQVDSTPAQSLNAAFDLRSAGDSGELRLNTPIGTRLAAARWSPGEAVLSDGRGEQRFSSLDELSRQAIGEAVPLAALPDWLAGRPWAGARSENLAGGFEQLGWRVDTSRRSTAGVVEARREAPPAVTVRVRLDDPA